jgi:hypothetical protein
MAALMVSGDFTILPLHQALLLVQRCGLRRDRRSRQDYGNDESEPHIKC